MPVLALNGAVPRRKLPQGYTLAMKTLRASAEFVLYLLLICLTPLYIVGMAGWCLMALIRPRKERLDVDFRRPLPKELPTVTPE